MNTDKLPKPKSGPYKLPESESTHYNLPYTSTNIIPSLPVVGHLIVAELGAGDLQIHMTKKPNWFNRLMMRVCFGFVWVDKPIP